MNGVNSIEALEHASGSWRGQLLVNVNLLQIPMLLREASPFTTRTNPAFCGLS